MEYKLEICIDSLRSALVAQEAGASRVELCDNLIEGGTTPSYGTIMAVREKLRIGLNILVRPRGGDFLYSEDEYDILCRDAEICRKAGADGVVIGFLTKDGDIDTIRTAELVRLAGPMSVTFHRAFDMCRDPYQGLKDLIGCGVARILTSGQKRIAEEGIDLLSELVNRSSDKIIIMPGSGINENNIESIASKTGAREFHLSARKVVPGLMQYRKPEITMGGVEGYDEFSGRIADLEKIKKVISILGKI
jgi:copper homeostasis protein